MTIAIRVGTSGYERGPELDAGADVSRGTTVKAAVLHLTERLLKLGARLNKTEINALRELIGDINAAIVNSHSDDNIPHSQNSQVGLRSSNKTYPDVNPELPKHKAINFSYNEPRHITHENFLVECLGEYGNGVLMDTSTDIKQGFHLRTWVSDENEVELLLSHRSKPKIEIDKETREQYRKNRDREGFDPFEMDKKVMVVCALVVKAARESGIDLSQSRDHWKDEQRIELSKLTKGEFEFLARLHGGAIYAPSGRLAFYISK